MTKTFQRIGGLVALGGVFLAVVGCGSSQVGGRNVVTVSGAITFEGNPVEVGEVLFESEDAEQRAFAAPIISGKYSIKTEPGPKIVRISGFRDIPGKFETLPAPEGQPPVKLPVKEAYLPAKYNSESELRFTVDSKGSNEANFDLKP